MAQFFTDFSEYTADAQPSDWTERWHTGDGAANVRDSGIPGTPSTGGSHALEVVLSTDSRYAISWDEVGDVTGDVQLLVLMYFEHTADDEVVLRTFVHGSGSTTESAYFGQMSFDRTDETELIKYNPGATLGAVNEGLTRNSWIWVRLDRSGDTIRLRAWEDGTSEPGTWSISTTDTDHGSGWIGLGAFGSLGTNWFAQIGVGTGGDEAPAESIMEITSVTPSEFADGDTGVTIAGSGFEASQGTGKVELGDGSDYATATLVEQTVTSWGDTSIDFTVVQGTLSPGPVWVFVTSDSGSTTSGLECELINIGTGDLTVPMLGISGSGITKFTGTGALLVPAPTVAATGITEFPGTGALLNPMLQVSGQGTATEPTGTGDLTMPIPQLAAQGSAPSISGTGELLVPMLSLESAGLESYPGTSDLTLFSLKLEGTGLEAYPGTSQLLVPFVKFQSSGLQRFIGTGLLTLPFITLVSFAGTRDQTYTIEGSLRYPVYRGSLLIPQYTHTVPYRHISTLREL